VPKILLLVYFAKPWNGKVGVFYGHLVFLWQFGVFCGHLVIVFQFWFFELKNLATLVTIREDFFKIARTFPDSAIL
jgi:hypothetical protein